MLLTPAMIPLDKFLYMLLIGSMKSACHLYCTVMFTAYTSLAEQKPGKKNFCTDSNTSLFHLPSPKHPFALVTRSIFTSCDL